MSSCQAQFKLYDITLSGSIDFILSMISLILFIGPLIKLKRERERKISITETCEKQPSIPMFQTKVPSTTATDDNIDNNKSAITMSPYSHQNTDININNNTINKILRSPISSGSATTESPSTKPFRSIAGIQIEVGNIDSDTPNIQPMLTSIDKLDDIDVDIDMDIADINTNDIDNDTNNNDIKPEQIEIPNDENDNNNNNNKRIMLQ